MECPRMREENLNKILISTFPGAEDIDAGKNCTLWNPIFNYFNYAVDKLDFFDWGCAVVRSTSPKELI